MLSYNTPLLTNHTKSEGFSPSFSSIVMCSVAISYVLMSLIVTKFYKIISKRGVIFIGMILSITGIIITGTVNLGTFKNVPFFIVLGLTTFGFGLAMVTIPVLPEMLDSIE